MQLENSDGLIKFVSNLIRPYANEDPALDC